MFILDRVRQITGGAYAHVQKSDRHRKRIQKQYVRVRL